MIIGVDGNEANVENRVGIGEYAFELLRQFSKFQPKADRPLDDKDLKFKIYLKHKPLEHMPKESENWEYRIINPKKLWTQIALPFDLLFHNPKPDVLFTPSHYAPRFSAIPTVVSVMDLSYIHFPRLFKKSDLYQLKNWTAYSVKNAKRVFTISEASKNDILKEYKIPQERVVVTYPGLKETMKNNTKSLFEKPYILFVGTLQPRKNISKLIEAFASLGSGFPDLQLVIVGKKGWLYEEILEAPRNLGVEKKVHFLDFVKEDELPNLYSNAKVFVLPSLYEGFGLPVVEAMKYGCPVITSNISSLPEAGGDAALYVNPENVKEIAQAIQKVLSDKKLRDSMVKKGYDQIEKFSWEKTAQKTLEVLQEVVHER